MSNRGYPIFVDQASIKLCAYKIYIPERYEYLTTLQNLLYNTLQRQTDMGPWSGGRIQRIKKNIYFKYYVNIGYYS